MFDLEHWPEETSPAERYQSSRTMFGMTPPARGDGKLMLSMLWSFPCKEYEAWKQLPLDSWKNEFARPLAALGAGSFAD